MQRVRIIAICAVCALGAKVFVSAKVTPRAPKGVPGSQVSWKKFTLDSKFRSEGVAVGDFNHDGLPDVCAGNMWYEAPNWTPHEFAPAQEFDGEHGYSNSFMNFAADVNGDGWVDQIVIGFPGDKCYWRENPKGAPGPWKEHIIWKSACNESATMEPLFGKKRKPVMVFGYDEKTMAWYEPGKDVNAEWINHDVSIAGQPGAQRFSHGLGVGDVNGDGRADILTSDGYYEAPADPRTGPWKFVPWKLGGACAHMVVYDVNGDGLPDIICSSAHGIGIWWFEQKKTASGSEWIQHVIDDTVSQTHSLVLADINGDGLPDIVTGKRFWAHGPKGDVNPGDPAVINWYELTRKNGEVKWIKHEVDNDSGVGTQFTVADVNKDGKLDIITSNKKGVHVFIQERKK